MSRAKACLRGLGLAVAVALTTLPVAIAGSELPPDPATLKLRDFQLPSDLTVNTLPGLENLKLADIDGAAITPIGEFPGLSQVTLGNIPGFDPMLYGIPTNCGEDYCPQWQQWTIQDAVEMGYLPADLLTSPASALPGLDQLTLGEIPGISSAVLSSIPGLGSTLASSIPFTCFLPQLVDHVNYDYNGFTEFAVLPQRFNVGQEVVCGPLKIRHSRVDEAEGKGYFDYYIWTSCGPFCWFWLGPFPWQTAVENGWWLGPLGNNSTTDQPGYSPPPPRPPMGPPAPPPRHNPAPPHDPPPRPPTAGDKQQRIATTARNQLNRFCTRNIPGTQNGNLGCAAAVNGVVQIATGKQVGGGLSTALMDRALSSGSGTPLAAAQVGGGDIIISPTEGSNVGHVGICLTDGCAQIASNSSSAGCFKQNFTLNRWISYYQGKGLAVKFYRVR